MYLRVRKLEKEKVEKGTYVVVLAKQLEGSAIAMQPGQLEWWDGLEWHEVKIVENADNRSPYAP